MDPQLKALEDQVARLRQLQQEAENKLREARSNSTRTLDELVNGLVRMQSEAQVRDWLQQAQRTHQDTQKVSQQLEQLVHAAQQHHQARLHLEQQKQLLNQG